MLVMIQVVNIIVAIQKVVAIHLHRATIATAITTAIIQVHTRQVIIRAQVHLIVGQVQAAVTLEEVGAIKPLFL
ncbi:hypothetical protein BC351_01165 [Paenibacillus ferrarius]|uniref:Uncharacterized protein n=1 Tax=Paenibacillus ferrarius TaxID=1469647 RepID=A0A1V4HSH1_9BACL|nr:hypothetical protein BC351_01165 [Paenibacillus ferrarius]